MLQTSLMLQVFKHYGMIIIAECHHQAAFTYEQAIDRVNSKYEYGFTTTLDRKGGHRLS